ncbi:hypothetical protein AVEN_237803-1 [Araneus ventricosus]|uniref:Uncharacterized protein n=1 Tax=Araneus ventricosus TaxID=182803 RepID=A0A4Y2PSY1_ARAVE|nr:hypothetical protein AVEN_237803-1 [Araneus ventricosus]
MKSRKLDDQRKEKVDTATPFDLSQGFYRQLRPICSRLLWNSLPVPFISHQEISLIFGELLCDKEIWDTYLFYTQALATFMNLLIPDHLKHLCRAVVRGTFGRQKWIPDGINELSSHRT